MIDEEKEEEGLEEGDGSVTSTRDGNLTPSVRKKLSAALSYSHGNFGKTEVGRVALEGRREHEEEMQQVYAGAAENEVVNKMRESPEKKSEVGRVALEGRREHEEEMQQVYAGAAENVVVNKMRESPEKKVKVWWCRNNDESCGREWPTYIAARQ